MALRQELQGDYNAITYNFKVRWCIKIAEETSRVSVLCLTSLLFCLGIAYVLQHYRFVIYLHKISFSFKIP